MSSLVGSLQKVDTTEFLKESWKLRLGLRRLPKNKPSGKGWTVLSVLYLTGFFTTL